MERLGCNHFPPWNGSGAITEVVAAVACRRWRAQPALIDMLVRLLVEPV
ncbi:MAG: hypothetical protein ACJ757_03830 [Gaiellaceae bacterium]